MAVPTITSDATLIHAMDSTTGLGTWGSNGITKWGATTDFYIENGTCVALAPKSTGDSGIGDTATGGISLSTNRLFIWIYVASTAFINSSGSTPAGVYIRICTSTSSWTAEYNDYYIGGSDVAWCAGGWHLVALDCNRTADRTAGTTTLTNINRVGVGFNIAATASKSDVLCIDVMRYGTKMEVTGVTSSAATVNLNDNGGSADTITRASGSFVTDGFESGDTIRISGSTYNDGEYTVVTAAALTLTLVTGDFSQTETSVAANVDAGITLESIYQKDGPTDDNWYGAVSKDRNGNYEINYKLIAGDESGTGRTFFLSRGDSIIFSDQPLSTSTAELVFDTAEDTGNTIVAFGESTGTGDDRVGFNGSNIRQDDTFISTSTNGSALCKLVLSTAIDTMEFFGTTVQDVNDGADFAADSTHYVTNSTFAACGQIDLSSVEARNLTFSGYDGAADAALLWSGTIDIKNSRFLANRNSTSNSAAIEHPALGTFDYYGLAFAGNDYDVNFSAASGNLVINNQPGSNASTYEKTGAGTVKFNTAVNLTISTIDTAGADIAGAQVYIQKTTPHAYTSHATNNAQGDLTLEVQEAIHATTGATGVIKVYDDSEETEHMYRYASWDTSTFTLVSKIGPVACTGGGTSTALEDDTTTNFLTADIEVGDTVRNETDGSWAIVLEITDADNITTTPLQGGSDDTWTSGDNYSFHNLAVLYTGSDTARQQLMNEITDSSGDAVSVYNYVSPVEVTVKAVKAGYKPNKSTQTVGSSGLTQTLTMQTEPNYNL